MREISWGMIGCGDVAERKSGPAFQAVRHSHLVAVTSRSPERTRDYAHRHGVPRVYDDAQGIFDDPEINAVYIATPPDAHMEYTIRAARAGKAVYVEKPMARTHAECLAMLDACRAANVPLFVAYYRRCLPAFEKIKQMVDGGAIGPVRFVTVQLYHPFKPGDEHPGEQSWRVRPEVSGGGYFYDLASHQLDYLDFLFGPILDTRSQVANQARLYEPEDILSASWTHAGGVLGSGLWCFTVAPEQQTDRAEIVGSRGRITFSFFQQQPVILETAQGEEKFYFPRQDPIQQPLIERVVQHLRGEGASPSTGDSAARTNLVMERMTRAATENYLGRAAKIPGGENRNR